MNFVLEKQLIKFSFTYQPLSICKTFIKKVLELIQSYEGVCHFWDQNSSFVLNKILLGINHCYSFIYLWPFSLCKISKKSYNGSRIMTMHHFWAQSGPFTSNNFFFQLAESHFCLYLRTRFFPSMQFSQDVNEP